MREMVSAKHRVEDEHDQRMVLAYTTAALQRARQLPDLKTLLTKREVKQNAQQMLSVVKMISEAYGLPLRKAKRKKKR